jgi:beta-phosphoglucomutase
MANNFLIDEWKVVEDHYNPNDFSKNETIFALGNGYFGLRGTYEEQISPTEGTYINGFYDSVPIVYPETAYGWAKTRQTILNVTDGKRIYIEIDGEKFSLEHVQYSHYSRTLDLQKGTLERKVTWTTKTGKITELCFKRIVSLSHQHTAAIQVSVKPLNWEGGVSITSTLNAKVFNISHGDDPRIGAHFKGQAIVLEEIKKIEKGCIIDSRTVAKRFQLLSGVVHNFQEKALEKVENVSSHDQEYAERYTFKVEKGEALIFDKFLCYIRNKGKDIVLPMLGIEKELDRINNTGFDELCLEQEEYLQKFWTRADVEVRGDSALQQALRFNLFHMLQSVGKDGETNIASKGVTGEGYEGHYFWDTECNMLPMFIYIDPESAKSLLMYRYNILPKARERAEELSHKGALWAWRTIDGEELSAYFPAGTAQYHINMDIMFALKKYYKATHDEQFLVDYGAEMLFENARFLLSLGDFIEGRGFCINCVTGPDEYTALINNNFYTNMMAKDSLEFALSVHKKLEDQYPEKLNILIQKLKLKADDISSWKRAAEEMYFFFDEKLGIYGQDDSFLSKAHFDWKSLPKEKLPLLLHFHYLNIYRYQVLKQPDAILLFYTVPEKFSKAEKKRHYDYYEPLCTHDSSLSYCIHGIVAAELGMYDIAYQYCMNSARIDLDDLQGNTYKGIHGAAMAGSWLGIVYGFGGLKLKDDKLHFTPVCPKQWESYTFRLNFQNRLLKVSVNKKEAVYTLLEGEPLSFYHKHKFVDIKTPGVPVSVSINRHLKGVIFDLDGVVTDTAEHHYKAWGETAAALGVSFDREFNEHLKGVSRMESLELILKKGDVKLSAEEKTSYAAEKNERYLDLISKLTPSDILPGILEFITELKNSGIKIGLASASKNATFILDKLRLTKYFDCIVDAGTLTKGKPDPEIFYSAAEKLELDYEDCVGVEDSLSGVQSIKGANNMFAVFVSASEQCEAADLKLKATSDLTLSRLKQALLEAGWNA